MPRYQKTNATVISGDLIQVIAPTSGIKYSPRITYRFSVDGRDYTGERHTQQTIGYPHGSAEKVLTKYPASSTVQVYYDPANPQDSFIQKGAGSAVWGMVLLILVMMVVVGGGMLLLILTLAPQ